MTIPFRIIKRENEFYPQYLTARQQWRCYENRYEQDMGYPTEQLALELIKAKITDARDQQLALVEKHRALAAEREQHLKALDTNSLLVTNP